MTMMLSRFFTTLALVGLAFAATDEGHLTACQAVGVAISNASRVYYPGDPLYTKGKYHYSASSQQSPACVVEPGTSEDIGRILKVIGATRTPFAVKSGGHTFNPGFSSTKGIQIYTGRFSQVTYDPASGTAVIGSGLIWDTVYERLQDHNVIVLGGRVTGVGVGGFALGGGYSFKTNQHGLSLDTIVAFNLVLPNGTVTYVTQSTHPDLFFGLKGGFNNFGIVTDFTMTTFPQTKVYAGQVTYLSPTFKQLRAAIANFSVYSRDPKAVILPSYISLGWTQFVSQTFFYDAPTAPPGIFDNFTKIASISSDLKTRSYLDLVLSSGSNTTAGLRSTSQMVSVSHFSQTFLEKIEEELANRTSELTPKSGVFFGYTAEPFLPNYLSHANSPSAWPAPSARRLPKGPSPLFINFYWLNARYDDEFVAAVEESANYLAAIARQEGSLIDDPPTLYGNYVNGRTPLADIYGENLPRLQALKGQIDPENVMGLTGGFKF